MCTACMCVGHMWLRSHNISHAPEPQPIQGANQCHSCDCIWEVHVLYLEKIPHEQIDKLIGIFGTGEYLFLFSSNTKKHQAPNSCTQQVLYPYPLIERFHDL
jgi:hypothetical protein